MLTLLSGFLFVAVFTATLIYQLFSYLTRVSVISRKVLDTANNLISSTVSHALFTGFFIFVLVENVLGNIPLAIVPTLFYSKTLTLALMFWVPLMVCVSISDAKSFFSHLLPYGCPAGLMLILPLIEGFSLAIRPFTLIIRLSTNLAAGHIMLYMFSYFTLLNPLLPIPIRVLISGLYFLEIFISALQAYIFFSLLSLYAIETVSWGRQL